MTEQMAIEKIKAEACSDRLLSIHCDDSCLYGADKCEWAVAIQALEEIQQYRAIEKRLEVMFGGKLPLERYVDELERQLLEPNSPHPMNARILTYAESDMWEQYKAIGTVEELQALKEKKGLPCKVGDTVYVLCDSLRKEKSYGAFSDKKLIFEDEPMPKYVECNVVGISFKNKGNYIKVRYVGNFEEKIFDYETGYDYRVITDSIDMNFVFSSIGKTVFLTKEEAEQHLDWE